MLMWEQDLIRFSFCARASLEFSILALNLYTCLTQDKIYMSARSPLRLKVEDMGLISYFHLLDKEGVRIDNPLTICL